MTAADTLARPSVRHAGRALRLPAHRWWFAGQTLSMTGLAPFTAMLTGPVADHAGGRIAFALSGVAFTLVTAATWRTPRSAR